MVDWPTTHNVLLHYETPMFKENDKSKAICNVCEKVVSTTLKIRDVKTSDTKKVIKDILVSVCDECEATVAIPAQSTPEIKKQLKQ